MPWLISAAVPVRGDRRHSGPGHRQGEVSHPACRGDPGDLDPALPRDLREDLPVPPRSTTRRPSRSRSTTSPRCTSRSRCLPASASATSWPETDGVRLFVTVQMLLNLVVSGCSSGCSRQQRDGASPDAGQHHRRRRGLRGPMPRSSRAAATSSPGRTRRASEGLGAVARPAERADHARTREPRLQTVRLTLEGLCEVLAEEAGHGVRRGTHQSDPRQEHDDSRGDERARVHLHRCGGSSDRDQPGQIIRCG